MTTPYEDTQRWLQEIVIGLNLCPFAAPVLAEQTIDIVVSDAADDERLLEDIAQQLLRLKASRARDVDTVLIVFSHALQSFDRFLECVAMADDTLDALALRGVLQLASFHPDYCFDGAAADARENYTNRSPWPMLHVLREASVSAGVANHPDTAAIPARNQRLLAEMPAATFERLFRRA